MNYYENIFILSPDLDDNTVESVVERVKNVVVKSGGEILKTENWGRKKLAYNLKKQNKGVYIFLIFKAPSPAVYELEIFYKVLEPLLKFMVVKLKKKQIDAVLSSLAVSVEQQARDHAAPAAADKPSEATHQEKGEK